MKRRRRRLGSAFIQSTKLPTWGLGAGATMCRPAAEGRRVQVCVTRPAKPSASMEGPDDVCRLLKNSVNADRESFYALHLDIKNRIVGIEEIAKGGLAEVGVHPREVFKSAILTNAAAIIVAHNHPSGDPTPSPDDFTLTARLIAAGKVIGIPVRDHIVVAADGCASLRSQRPSMGFGGARLRKGRK